MKLKSISVFLPAYNEQENIIYCVKSVEKYLKKKFEDYEIIVVTSGSNDNTGNFVSELIKKNKRIKLVDDKKKGYGVALKGGFKNSKKDLIFYTDADNQFNINDLDKLIPLIQKFDVVSAYRIKRKDPMARLLTANVYNLLIRILFGLKIKDIDASFKLFKKKVIESMKLKSNTGLIDAEVLIKAKKNGFNIGQIGVKHYPRTRGQTIYATNSIVKPKVVIDILKEIKILWQDLK